MNILRKGARSDALSATVTEIDEDDAGQRIDNFLTRVLKGVPKSHIYQLLRTGQVRVNSRRTAPTYRLQVADRVRLPPVRTAAPAATRSTSPRAAAEPRLSGRALFEDDALLIIDKPAGVAAHGGSGISSGVIERLRAERPELRFLELVHRLDRDTSGVLLLAKKRSALTNLHSQIRDGEVGKWYLTLVHGRWTNAKQHVRLSLNKFMTAAGERRVSVNPEGLPSHTVFKLVRNVGDYSVLQAELKTGRTHQIRVHLAHLGFPIAGDDKYGDFALNKALQREGLKRMFLHAERVVFRHPLTNASTTVEAKLPAELKVFIDRHAKSPEATPIE